MPEVEIAPYGSWRSPITPELIATDGVSFGHLALEGDVAYWLETRPTRAGAASWSAARLTERCRTLRRRATTLGPECTSTVEAHSL